MSTIGVLHQLPAPTVEPIPDRSAFCDVCGHETLFVALPPELTDAGAELALAAPGHACAECGAGRSFDAVLEAFARRAA